MWREHHGNFSDTARKAFLNYQLVTNNYMLETLGQRQDAQETQKRRPGPGSRALAWSCPWAQALAASFVVAGDPEASPRSPVYECGSEVADLENRFPNRAEMSIYNQAES